MIPYIRHVRVGKVMEKDVGLACVVESEDHLLMAQAYLEDDDILKLDKCPH